MPASSFENGRGLPPSRRHSRESAHEVRTRGASTGGFSTHRSRNGSALGASTRTNSLNRTAPTPWCPAGVPVANGPSRSHGTHITGDTRRPQSRNNKSLASTAPAHSLQCNSINSSGGSVSSRSLPQRDNCTTFRVHWHMAFESEWSQLPDAVLLQAIVLLRPGEVCATVCTCGTWAETVTASEAWLWSIVGSSGLPPDIFVLLRHWATVTEASCIIAL